MKQWLSRGGASIMPLSMAALLLTGACSGDGSSTAQMSGSTGSPSSAGGSAGGSLATAGTVSGIMGGADVTSGTTTATSTPTAGAGGATSAGAGTLSGGDSTSAASSSSSGVGGATGVGGGPSGGAGGVGGAGLGGGGGGGGLGGVGGAGGIAPLPDPGSEGDGDFTVGPSYPTQSDLQNQGNPQGKSFDFSMPLAQSAIFDGTDSTLEPGRVSATRSISVYVPAQYHDGDAAPVLIIQDGPGEIGMVKNALDNLTVSQDPARKLPPFVAIAVQNGGNDSIGSERGLEYDTLSDRYARFIELEVMPAVVSNAEVKAAYPNLKFTKDPSGRATLGCSSGGAAAFTMAWFRPDLFSRVIAYSTTLVAQQDPDAPEAEMYPFGAWEYHSSLELIKNDATLKEKQLRIFLNVNENDLGSTDPESTHHNWVMANQRTAAALSEKGFHYKFVFGQGAGHCAGGVQNNTLADALVWAWRGYEPSGL